MIRPQRWGGGLSSAVRDVLVVIVVGDAAVLTIINEIILLLLTYSPPTIIRPVHRRRPFGSRGGGHLRRMGNHRLHGVHKHQPAHREFATVAGARRGNGSRLCWPRRWRDVASINVIIVVRCHRRRRPPSQPPPPRSSPASSPPIPTRLCSIRRQSSRRITLQPTTTNKRAHDVHASGTDGIPRRAPPPPPPRRRSHCASTSIHRIRRILRIHPPAIADWPIRATSPPPRLPLPPPPSSSSLAALPSSSR